MDTRSKTSPELISNPASILLVGEFSQVLRGQGRPFATGLVPGEDAQSPLVSGKYVKVPQTQIGLMTHDDFMSSASDFLSLGSSDMSPWNVMGAVSLDAIFCPYNNMADEHRAGPFMPYWTDPTGDFSNKAGTSKTLNPFDPFYQLKNLRYDGNVPLSTDPWMSGGHNLAFALSYNPTDSGLSGKEGYVGISGTYPSGRFSPADYHFEKDHFIRHTVERSGIRSVGLKSPLVLSGWGYDVNNLPVPASDENPQHFHPHASWNTHLWKSGPIDLRWDEQRGVWTGHKQRVYLVKMTNLYTPPSFSFEVDRSNTRDQYTRNAPTVQRSYDPDANLYDPEYVAYDSNRSANYGYYEQLDYGNGSTYPYYEAFIIRETDDGPVPDQNFYNTWAYDCNDCGHISNSGQCGGEHNTESTLKKILIENPLRQSFDVGDLAFTVYTGRQQRVNTGTFTGGNGTGAAARIITDADGVATLQVISAGENYTTGGFGIVDPTCPICANVSLNFNVDGELTGGTVTPNEGFIANWYCNLTIYPNNASIDTELLPIHWVIQAEFKSQQVVTHAECDNGIFQTCTMKIQTQGYKTCEWCGEDTAYINS